MDARTASYAATRDAAAALLPRRVRGDHPGRGCRAASARPISSRAGDDRHRGARRPADIPARAARPAGGARVARDGLVAARGRATGDPAHRRCASGSRSPRRRTRDEAAGAEPRRRRGVRLRRRAGPAGHPAPRARGRAHCRSPHACRPTRRCSETASAGSCSSPARPRRSTAHLARLIAEPAAAAPAPAESERLREALGWPRVADELERDLRGPRRPPPRPRRRPAPAHASELTAADRRRPAHAHRSLQRLRDARSRCCSPRPAPVAWARSPSPTTTRSRARSMPRAKANGVKVIVGEEVKTAEQGEVIGLFIEEKIPRGHDPRRRRSPRSSARAASSTCPTRSTACTRCRTTSTCWR